MGTLRKFRSTRHRRITRPGLVASTGSRQTGWTKLRWAGITMNRWTSMRARPSRLTSRQGLLDMVIGMMWLGQWGLIMSRPNQISQHEMLQILNQGLREWHNRVKLRLDKEQMKKREGEMPKI